LRVPELPEVETVCRTLRPRIVGRRVRAARLLRRDVLIAPGDPVGGFSRQRGKATAKPAAIEPEDLLQGCIVTEVLRRGKQIALIGRGGGGREHVLIVQLGMSGQLFIEPARESKGSAHTHVHAVWEVEGARGASGRSRADAVMTMYFRDPRRFGGLRVLRSREELAAHWQLLGPDALELKAEDLLRVCRESVRAIKAVLMDQAAVAGVGNIYADEALFRAQVRPSRRAARVKATEAVALAEAIRQVLRESIDDGGSTLRDYRDADGRQGGYQGRHAVYGRGGLLCVRCGRTLREGLLAQRTTVWCPGCQR